MLGVIDVVVYFDWVKREVWRLNINFSFAIDDFWDFSFVFVVAVVAVVVVAVEVGTTACPIAVHLNCIHI